jgi:predicted enzyme related to lactoylglutathione lyase
LEIPGAGWLAVFTDPMGNRIGLYTGMPQQG